MAETLSDTVTRLRTFILESNPNADLAPGTVLSELIVKLCSTAQNPIINDITTLDQAAAVNGVLTNSVDTYSPIIDGIASNYNTLRNQGTKSLGVIKVTMATSGTAYLRAGFTFVQPVLQLNYITTMDYRVVSVPTQAGDLQLFNNNGVYYFLIPVVAGAVGTSYQVNDQSQFSIGTGYTLVNFVNASAYGNFTSGQALETDKQLVARFQESITNGSLLTHNSISYRLSQLYPNVTAVSVIGGNDPEMTRSKENLFGISTLGMADVYIRGSVGPETILVTKTANVTGNTVVDENGNSVPEWTLTINSTDAPGFYRIISILPSNKGLTGTLINTPTFGYSTAGIAPSNVVNNLFDARFTMYQNCVTTFGYQIAGNPASASFDILLAYQPNIADIQNLFLNNSTRIACADYLVKSVVPCYVTVSVTLHRQDLNTALPLAAIKQDIFNYVNSIPFGTPLYASEIVKICHKYPIKYMDLPITIIGDIYTANSTVVSISNNDVLTIPTDLNNGITPNTTLFFIDYFQSSNANAMSDSIGITVL